MMTTAGEMRRSSLFWRFSTNLALVRPDLAGQYVCPICLMGGFTEASVLGPTPDLTEEDCIPKGLGQIVTVLTCATCNNTAGTEIDSELHKLLRFDSFRNATMQEPMKLRLDLEGQNLGIELKRTGGSTPHLEIKTIEGQAHPESLWLAEEMAKESAQQGVVNDMQLHFGPNVVPHKRKALTAVLKAAYLLLFEKFGYAAILEPVLNPVRQQIRNCREQIVPLESAMLPMSAQKLPPMICIVTSPGLRGLAVPVPFAAYDSGYLGILPVDDQTYARWDEWYREHREAGTHSCGLGLVPLERVHKPI